MVNLKKEFNDERTAQRLSNIPLKTKIIFDNNKTYIFANKDWSATGIGLYKPENFDETKLQINKIYDAYILLETATSLTKLKVKITLKNIHKKVLGFAFENLSEANKRTIRNYISNIIEGNINTVESITADLAMPDIKNPSEELISLDSDHKFHLEKAFKRKTFFNITLFIIFIIIAILTIIYNYSISYTGYGITTNNYFKYKIPEDIIIKKIYKKENEKIKKNELLFSYIPINKQEYLYRQKLINENQNKINNLKNKLKILLLQQKEILINNLIKKKIFLKQKKILEKNYKNALFLYKQRIITKNIIEDYENKIFKNLIEKQRQLLILINPIRKVYSITDGKIYNIKVKENQFLQKGKTVLIVQTNKKSIIYLNIPKKEVEKENQL